MCCEISNHHGPKESSFILLQAGLRCHVYCILLRFYLLALNHFSMCTLVAKDIRRPYISVTTSLHSRSEDTNSLALRGGPRKPPLQMVAKFCPNKTTSSESSVGVAAKVISAEFGSNCSTVAMVVASTGVAAKASIFHY